MDGILEVTSGAYWQNLLGEHGRFFRKRTCLYIGAHCNGGVSFVPELLHAGYGITVVEAYDKNVDELRAAHAGTMEIVCDDIRTWEPPTLYDMVMWWHGPEHLPKDDFSPAMDKVSAIAQQVVIVGCPFGEMEHGNGDDNPYEIHQAALYPKDFEGHGFEVKTFGEADKVGSQLVAMKVVEC